MHQVVEGRLFAHQGRPLVLVERRTRGRQTFLAARPALATGFLALGRGLASHQGPHQLFGVARLRVEGEVGGDHRLLLGPRLLALAESGLDGGGVGTQIALFAAQDTHALAVGADPQMAALSPGPRGLRLLVIGRHVRRHVLPQTLRHVARQRQLEDLVEPLGGLVVVVLHGHAVQPFQQQIRVLVRRPIPLGIHRVLVAAVGLRIGGPRQPHQAEDRQVVHRRDPLVLQRLAAQRARRSVRGIPRARLGDKPFHHEASQLLNAAKHPVLHDMQVLLPHRPAHVLVQLQKQRLRLVPLRLLVADLHGWHVPASPGLFGETAKGSGGVKTFGLSKTLYTGPVFRNPNNFKHFHPCHLGYARLNST